LLHLKEWIDAIRGKEETSCNIDAGFEEAVTFNLANLAYDHKKTFTWDKVNEKTMLFMYYISNPPFIDLDDPSVAEGSYLLVNKNLIELFTLLVLFLFPTGKITGLDRLLSFAK